VFPRLRFDETCAAPHATSQPTLASFRASSDLSARSDGICARGHAFVAQIMRERSDAMAALYSTSVPACPPPPPPASERRADASHRPSQCPFCPTLWKDQNASRVRAPALPRRDGSVAVEGVKEPMLRVVRCSPHRLVRFALQSLREREILAGPTRAAPALAQRVRLDQNAYWPRRLDVVRTEFWGWPH